jgi:methyltransferase
MARPTEAKMLGKRVCVAIPDTVLEEHDSLRDKTLKLGLIARYCSIFGVDLIRIFHDPRGRGESAFMRRVLEYLETPQYLRKRLFPLSDELRFAGLLPPLRTPSHRPRVALDRLQVGEYREGFVLADGTSADVGLDSPARLERRAPPNKRATVRVTGRSPLTAVVVDRREVGLYWGYAVDVCGMTELLGDPAFPLKIATSRGGDPLADSLPSIRAGLETAKGVMLIFGSPSRGLFQTFGRDLREKVGYVVNLFPEQNVATVRSEEAMLAALYLLDLLLAGGFRATG